MTERARARLSVWAGAALAGSCLAACASLPEPDLATAPPPPEALKPAPALSLPRTAQATKPKPFPRTAQRGRSGGRYKIGDPYRVAGKLYVPADQPNYDEIGVASWYGEDFHARATANGERFDMYSASAAHTTLPLPSIVEVTNLENGRSIRVRLNDRGPFKAGRIIDLSKNAARQLGYLEKGLARVRVRYIGPARLDGSITPLYVANASPADRAAQALASAKAPPAARAVWGDGREPRPAATRLARAGTMRLQTVAYAKTGEADLPPLW